MNLEVVYIGSFKCYKAFSFKMKKKKKKSPKKCDPLKNKNSSLGKRCKKDIEKGGKVKNGECKQFNNVKV